MRILCVGINHKTADVALRERLTFDANQAHRALDELRAAYPVAEFVVLGTCNRGEIYCARPAHGHPRESELQEFLGRFHGVGLGEYIARVYTLTDLDAARHLFEVASGLDSMVLGESQILGQVKSAYALAAERGATSAVLNQLFQQSFNVAKQVQAETDIAAGRVSVAGAAIDYATRALGSLSNRCVLNVGAGKMNVLMLRHLRSLGCRRFVILNRTPEVADRLAGEFGGQAGSLGELAEQLDAADVVVTSTAAATPIITREMVEKAQARRAGRPMLMIDIAVPRDVSPDVADVPGVQLCNIDDLDRAVRQSVDHRAKHLDACRAIIDRRVTEFSDWQTAREVTPIIESLSRHIIAIAEQELAAARNKLATHDDAEEDQQILERAIHRIVRRVLHDPSENLRASSGTEAGRIHAAALKKLFNLDTPGQDE